jgi:hypothetical protein
LFPSQYNIPVASTVVHEVGPKEKAIQYYRGSRGDRLIELASGDGDVLATSAATALASLFLHRTSFHLLTDIAATLLSHLAFQGRPQKLQSLIIDALHSFRGMNFDIPLTTEIQYDPADRTDPVMTTILMLALDQNWTVASTSRSARHILLKSSVLHEATNLSSEPLKLWELKSFRLVLGFLP